MFFENGIPSFPKKKTKTFFFLRIELTFTMLSEFAKCASRDKSSGVNFTNILHAAFAPVGLYQSY